MTTSVPMTSTTFTSPPHRAELAKALRAFQHDLPKVGKSARGNFGKYADLADLTDIVLPKLNEHGFSWTTQPTLHNGKFVLFYELLHDSGASISGYYPLTEGGPQQLGSAITYARRYSLCAVTGVAPDEDDDGTAAQAAHTQRALADRKLDAARAALEAKMKKINADPTGVLALYRLEHGDDADPRTETDAERLINFTARLGEQ